MASFTSLTSADLDARAQDTSVERRLPDTTLFLELTVNGVAGGHIIAVRHRGGRFFVRAGDLTTGGVRTDAADETDVALDALPRVQFRYDSHTQRLELTVPPEWLPTHVLGNSSLQPRVRARTSLGAVFNYDVLASAPANGQRYVTAWTEQRLFDRWGTIANTGILYHAFDRASNVARKTYLRYDTSWNHVDEDRLLTITAGDLITGAVAWTSAVRLGGLAIERNFTMRPDIVTYPLPAFAGQAAVPTAVDLFVNGSRVLSESVAPGPYVMDAMPLLNGAGEATVVTTDPLGRRTATTVPFYVASQLLRKRFYEYSAAVGLMRREFGIGSWSYGRPAASGVLRHGLTNALTLTSHAAGGDGLAVGGVGADVRVRTYGVFGVSLARGGSDSQSGNQYGASFSYSSRRYSVMARHLQRDSGFADLSTYQRSSSAGSSLARSTSQLTFAASPSRLGGTVGSSYVEVIGGDEQRSRFVNVSFSRRFMFGTSVYLSANRTIDRAGATSVHLQVVRPLGPRGSVTAAVDRSESNTTGRVHYARNAPPGGGLGWTASFAPGSDNDRQLDVTWRTRFAQVQGGTQGTSGAASRWLGVSGSVIALGREVAATNRVDDAFAVVDTAGYAGVPVLFENQMIGRTNGRGRLLVPWVSAYHAATFAIDPLALPTGVRVPMVEQRAAVRRRSGAIVGFPLAHARAALILLVNGDGGPLPAGAGVTHVETARVSVVGWGGQVYLEDLGDRNNLRITLPDGRTCTVAFELNETRGEAARVGPLPCK